MRAYKTEWRGKRAFACFDGKAYVEIVKLDGEDLIRRAQMVPPVNAALIRKAERARELGLKAVEPEPIYSEPDYSEAGFVALVQSIYPDCSPNGRVDVSGYMALLPHEVQYTDGTVGRYALIERSDGRIVRVDEFLPRFSTTRPAAHNIDLPEEWIDAIESWHATAEERYQRALAREREQLRAELAAAGLLEQGTGE